MLWKWKKNEEDTEEKKKKKRKKLRRKDASKKEKGKTSLHPNQEKGKTSLQLGIAPNQLGMAPNQDQLGIALNQDLLGIALIDMKEPQSMLQIPHDNLCCSCQNSMLVIPGLLMSMKAEYGRKILKETQWKWCRMKSQMFLCLFCLKHHFGGDRFLCLF